MSINIKRSPNYVPGISRVLTKGSGGGINTRLPSAGGGEEFLPNSIPGLTLWLDANDLGTLSISRPTTVTAWADKSEAGFNATTDSGTPTFSSSGGKNGVVFSNCRMYTNCIPATGAGGRTILIVTSEASYSPVVASDAYILHYGTSIGNAVWFGPAMNTGYGILNYRGSQNVYGNHYTGGSSAETFESTEPGTHSEAKVISCRYNGTVDAWKANNNSVGNKTVSLNTAVVWNYYIDWQPEGISLGSRICRVDPSIGPGPRDMCNSVKLHEVLVYDNSISDSDWTSAVNYLMSKWGVV